MAVRKQVATFLVGATLIEALLTAPVAVLAGQKPAAKLETKTPAKMVQPDVKFLEYLGSLESDEDNWTQLDVDQTNVEKTDTALAAPINKGAAKAEAAAKTAVEKKR